MNTLEMKLLVGNEKEFGNKLLFKNETNLEMNNRNELEMNRRNETEMNNDLEMNGHLKMN